MFQKLNPAKIYPAVSPYSHGVLIPAGADIIVTSGTMGIDAEGRAPADFEDQCKLLWSNIEYILVDAGWGLQDIVRINGFLKNRDDIAIFRKIRDEKVPQAPAATVVLADLLDPSWLIEMEVTAARLSRAASEALIVGTH